MNLPPDWPAKATAFLLTGALLWLFFEFAACALYTGWQSEGQPLGCCSTDPTSGQCLHWASGCR